MEEEMPDSIEFIYECDGCEGWVLSGSFCSTAAKVVETMQNEPWNKEEGQ